MPPTGPSPAQDSVSSRVIPIFTAATAIPVVLATVLIAIGWLMALPPTGFSELRQAMTASQPLREKSEESSPTSGAGSPTAAPMPAQTASEQSSRAPGKGESVTPSATPAAPTQLNGPAQDVATAGQGSLSPRLQQRSKAARNSHRPLHGRVKALRHQQHL